MSGIALRACLMVSPTKAPRRMMLSAPVSSGSMPIIMSISEDTVPLMVHVPLDGS